MPSQSTFSEAQIAYALREVERGRPPDALAAILVESVQAMPGCPSYVIATDPADDNALWITEVWDAQAMIAGFGSRVETAPIGGRGLGTTAPR